MSCLLRNVNEWSYQMSYFNVCVEMFLRYTDFFAQFNDCNVFKKKSIYP